MARHTPVPYHARGRAFCGRGKRKIAMPNRLSRRQRLGLLLTATALLASGPSLGQALDKPTHTCLNRLNKGERLEGKKRRGAVKAGRGKVAFD